MSFQRLIFVVPLFIVLIACNKDEIGFATYFEPAVRPTAYFKVVEIENCHPPYRVHIENLVSDTLGDETYRWEYGNDVVSAFINPTVAAYSQSGDYTIRLIVENVVGADTFDTVINLPDTLPITSDFDFRPAAYSYRAPAPVEFINLSGQSTSFTWEFGDNQTSTEKNPIHWFENPGDYTVTLFSECGNQEESSFNQVSILPPPGRVVLEKIHLQFLPEKYYNDSDTEDGTVGLDIFFEVYLDGSLVLTSNVIRGVLGGDLPIEWESNDPIVINDYNSSLLIRFFDDDFNGMEQFIATSNVELIELQDKNYPPEHIQLDQDDLEVKLALKWQN